MQAYNRYGAGSLYCGGVNNAGACMNSCATDRPRSVTTVPSIRVA